MVSLLILTTIGLLLQMKITHTGGQLKMKAVGTISPNDLRCGLLCFLKKNNAGSPAEPSAILVSEKISVSPTKTKKKKCGDLEFSVLTRVQINSLPNDLYSTWHRPRDHRSLSLVIHTA